MHILFLLFVTVPLVLLIWKFFVELPIEMLLDGNLVGALIWIAFAWGIPLILFVALSHR